MLKSETNEFKLHEVINNVWNSNWLSQLLDFYLKFEIKNVQLHSA